MTVRLLTAYDKYPQNAIVTLDAGTEAALVTLHMADTNLTGGVAYTATATPTRSDTLRGDASTFTPRLRTDDGSTQYLRTAKLSTAPKPFSDAVKNHATNNYSFLGFDAVDQVVWWKNNSGTHLLQAKKNTDWTTQAGVTSYNTKGWPTGVTIASGGIVKMLRFKGQIYLLAKDSADSTNKIYRAAPAADGTAFTWSAAVWTAPATTTTSQALYTCFSADASYLYIGEYGDPAGGPHVWRSADGTTWELIWDETLQGTPQRHVHAIAPDPYNPGHVYMTMGDGGAREWMRSTDYGATWVNLSISSTWQAVQISFSKDWVWGAGDSQNGHIILLDRETCTPRMGTLGSIKNMAVPAAAAVTDKFYVNAWYATVDPSTEVYYMTANDTSIAGSNTGGLFATPSIGSAPVLLDKFGTSAETPIEVVPFTGCVWCGQYKRPLL